MKQFVKIASLKDIPEKVGVHFDVDGLDIAVFKIDGEIFVLNNLCPHQHAPVLFEGGLDGYALCCPLHGWIFDLKTGQSENGQSKVTKYNFKLNGDDVFIEINNDLY
jgi:nitrite reductase/ring-hydroxylating ferredoxin subunit